MNVNEKMLYALKEILGCAYFENVEDPNDDILEIVKDAVKEAEEAKAQEVDVEDFERDLKHRLSEEHPQHKSVIDMVVETTINELEAKGHLTAIPEGYALVPIEPTEKMLVNVGTMEGYDGANGQADNDHIEWYKAMIAAAQEGEE